MTNKTKLFLIITLMVFHLALVAQHNVERMNDTETTKKVSTLLHLINGFFPGYG